MTTRFTERRTRLAAIFLALIVAACAGPAADPTLTSTPISPATDAPATAPTDQPATDQPPSSTPTSSSTPTPAPTTAGPSGPPRVGDWSEQTVVDGPAAREDHTWTVAGDGSALLFGGRAGRREFNDLWRYDLAADSWTELEPSGESPSPRFGHVAVWVAGVGLVIWSGQAGADFFSDVWTYDPLANEWRELPATGAIPPARYGSCGGLGPDGRLWISHGFTEDTGRFADTRAYDFTSGEWTDLTPDGTLPVERCLHDCLWTPDGRLVLYAGQTTGAPAIGDLWTYAVATGEWTKGPTPEPEPRQLYAITALGGTAFVFGGGAQDGSPLDDLWLLDLSSLEWSAAQPVGSLPAARSGATLIADPEHSRVLLFGGRGAEGELADLWRLELEPAG